MSRAHEEWTDRFTDYLSEELDVTSHEELEMHVAECADCRRVLEELRGVVSRARGLEVLQPTRDLWPGIAAAIRMPVRPQSAGDGVRVIALPTAQVNVATTAARRIAFTPPQLAAAAIILISLSVVTTWWAGPGLGVRVADSPEASAAGAVAMVAAVPAPPDALSEELATLEEILAAARARLDPNTVRVLERNLGVIEQAISDSHEALALDPENEFLTHHLERVYERKIAYLRDATRVLDWAG